MRINHEVKFVGRRLDFLSEYLAGKDVVHIGAGDSPYTMQKIIDGFWLHGVLSKSCGAVKGFDIDRASIDIAKSYGYENIEYADLFRVEREYFFGYEYILFGETIEHLSNPGAFLARISELMDDGQKLVVTTPNPFFVKNFWHNSKGFEVNHEDHKTHHTFYTLTRLLEECNLIVEEKYGAIFERKTQRWFSRLLTGRICRAFPLLCEDMIVVARKRI